MQQSDCACARTSPNHQITLAHRRRTYAPPLEPAFTVATLCRLPLPLCRFTLARTTQTGSKTTLGNGRFSSILIPPVGAGRVASVGGGGGGCRFTNSEAVSSTLLAHPVSSRTSVPSSTAAPSAAAPPPVSASAVRCPSVIHQG